MTNLNELAKEIHDNACEKGFWDNPKEIGTLLMLCVSELAEAMEADRKENFTEHTLKIAHSFAFTPYFQKEDCSLFENTIKDTFEDELADTIIRILDLCGRKNIDIEWHIEQKMKYNATREKLHKKKY